MDDFLLVNKQPETVSATFRLGWMGHEIEGQVTVPTAKVSPRILLPTIQRLTNALVELGEDSVKARGEAISCQAGCGACCRQLVPVSQSEARHLRDLVEAMPEPRRSEVKARFADAIHKLNEAGLLTTLRSASDDEATTTFGLQYLQHWVACPFLENEMCSIHPDRPLECREYLVTSPAVHCSNPTPGTIKRVPTPGWVTPTFAALDGPIPEGSEVVNWVPLVLALEWAEAHPEPPATETGPELFTQFMTVLTSKRIPLPPAFTAPPEVTP